MPKTILVTEANKNKLAADYDIDPYEMGEMVGLWLVAEFGERKPVMGYLTREKLEEIFHIRDQLENGYTHIARKDW